MSDDKRRELVGRVAAEYGIKLDPYDPSLMIVDMCAQVLDERLAEVKQHRGLGGQVAGAAAGQAVVDGLNQQVVPKLQAVVKTEIKAGLERMAKPQLWTHPAFTAIVGVLLGVILGTVLHRLG